MSIARCYQQDLFCKQLKVCFKKANRLIIELQQAVGSHIISIIYNPYMEGIKTPLNIDEKNDAWYITAIIENSKLKKANLILHGQGGDYKIGLIMAKMIRLKLDKFFTFVPSIYSSALCFPLLQSDGLYMAESANITQIDPLYEEEGKLLRAVEEQYKGTKQNQLKAKRIFSKCREQIIELIRERPSLYDHRREEWEAYADTENIQDMFMYKKGHLDSISYQEMVALNLKASLINKELVKTMKEYIECCQEILLWENRRVIFGCSKQFQFQEGIEASFLRIT